MSNNELQHHGILGQKWGIRRYQNEDGSLTAAGKKRYYKTIKSSYENQEHHILDSVIEEANNLYVSDKKKDEYLKITSELRSLEKTYRDKYPANILEDYKSKEYKELIKEAKQNVINNKNDDYLEAEKYAKDNGIDLFDTKIMDRNLSYEIYDLVDKKYEDAWNKTHKKNIQVNAEIDKLRQQQTKIAKSIAEDFLGKYGNKKIDKYSNHTVSDWVAINLSEKKIMDSYKKANNQY